MKGTVATDGAWLRSKAAGPRRCAPKPPGPRPRPPPGRNAVADGDRPGRRTHAQQRVVEGCAGHADSRRRRWAAGDWTVQRLAIRARARPGTTASSASGRRRHGRPAGPPGNTIRNQTDLWASVSVALPPGGRQRGGQQQAAATTCVAGAGVVGGGAGHHRAGGSRTKTQRLPRECSHLGLGWPRHHGSCEKFAVSAGPRRRTEQPPAAASAPCPVPGGPARSQRVAHELAGSRNGRRLRQVRRDRDDGVLGPLTMHSLGIPEDQSTVRPHRRGRDQPSTVTYSRTTFAGNRRSRRAGTSPRDHRAAPPPHTADGAAGAVRSRQS